MRRGVLSEEINWLNVYGFVPLMLILFLNAWVWMLVFYYTLRGEVQWRS